MNDSSDSPERADSPEPVPTQREARSVTGQTPTQMGPGRLSGKQAPRAPGHGPVRCR